MRSATPASAQNGRPTAGNSSLMSQATTRPSGPTASAIQSVPIPVNTPTSSARVAFIARIRNARNWPCTGGVAMPGLRPASVAAASPRIAAGSRSDVSAM